MQKKNAGIARNFALKGLLLLAALTLSTGFFACGKVTTLQAGILPCRKNTRKKTLNIPQCG